MKENQTYRLVATYLFIGLVCVTAILQSVHHYVGHQHETEGCSMADLHFHDEGHEHFSCNICLFNFEPTETQNFILTLNYPTAISTKLLYSNTKNYYSQKLRQSYLRGPPFFNV